MIARLLSAWRALTSAPPSPVPREFHDMLLASLRQEVIEVTRQRDEALRALIEERSPGTLTRLLPPAERKRVKVEPEGEEMTWP